jgi:hypothetical protein
MPTGSATPDLNQVQSRRALIGVGVLALALLASPFVLQSWNSNRELAGKVPVWEGQSAANSNDLLRCLVQRPTGGLVLSISRENEFYDARRGLAVRIELVGPPHRLKVWAAPGTTLAPSEQAQLTACLTPPPAKP